MPAKNLVFAMFLSLLSCGVLPSLGQPAPGPAGGALDITAQSTEYIADRNLMIARGNVVVRDGPNTLEADYMTMDTETMELNARGNVVYSSGTEVWQGEELTYNLKTKQGDFGQFSGFYDPFYITAETTRRVSTNETYFYNVRVTTCEGDNPPVFIKAEEASIRNNRIYMKRAVFYTAHVIPFMYVHNYSRSLGSHERFFQLLPGYNSRLGVFVLNAYNYPVAENVRGITHVDFYSDRGIGIGQDFVWRDREEETYEGAIRTYYIDDSEPLEGPDSENRTEDLIDAERYRLQLTHNHTLSPSDRFIGELNYVSDPFILQDYFDADFRYSVQPENRATLTHRGDWYTAALQLNVRLNDFYGNVNRIPELSLDIQRTEIADTGLYYESRSAAAYLERVFQESSDNEDYSAFRIDSDHTILYPTRHFGFLNFIPRAGYRATYYSETISRSTITNVVVVTDEFGDPVTNEFGEVSLTNQTETITMSDSAGLRNVFTLGWEASFKAFKTWDDYVILGDGDGVRHIIEPYLNHTYRPEPNLEPDELPQFDSIDRIGERHDIQLGLRNKLQTRRNQTPVDIIDLDVYTFYRIEKDEDDEDFSDIFFNADINLARWLPIEVRGRYDSYESEFNEVDSEIGLRFEDKSRIDIEHIYRRDNRSVLGLRLDLFPDARWAIEAGARHDIENSELEEQYYFIKNQRPCVSWGLGYRQIDDDEQIWLHIWLSAFPDFLVDVGN